MASKSAEITLNMSWGNCKQVLSGIQGRLGSVLKAASKLSGIGAMVGAGFGAVGAALAVGKGIMDRVAEAEKYRLELGDLENAKKRQMAIDKQLGYQSEESRQAYIDLQIQTEKLNWENRFLTETDIKVEEGMKNLKVAIGATQGIFVDMAMTMVSDWLPSMEAVETAVTDYVVPAFTFLESVVKACWNAIKLNICRSILMITGAFDVIVYTVSELLPYSFNYLYNNWTNIFKDLEKNIPTLVNNIWNNVMYYCESFILWLEDKLPTGWSHAVQDVVKIMGNMQHNIRAAFLWIIDALKPVADAFKEIGQFLKNTFFSVGDYIWGIFKKILRWVSDMAKKILNFGATILETMGLGGVAEKLKEFTSSLSGGTVDKVTSGENFQTNATVQEADPRKFVSLYAGVGKYDDRPASEKDRKYQYRNLAEGMTFTADKFAPPPIVWSGITKSMAKGMDDASKALLRIVTGQTYAQDLEKNKEYAKRNLAKSKDKQGDKETQPIGDWEMLKLLEGSQKASTEGLSSAYDRINNAVANKNPAVEVLQKLREQQKQQADEQKALEAKKAEKQAETASKTTESAASLDRIYNLLVSWKTPQAAVVEG